MLKYFHSFSVGKSVGFNFLKFSVKQICWRIVECGRSMNSTTSRRNTHYRSSFGAETSNFPANSMQEAIRVTPKDRMYEGEYDNCIWA